MAIGKYGGSIGSVVGGVIGGIIGGFAYGNISAGISIGSVIGGAGGAIAGQVFWPEKVDLSHPLPPKPTENKVQISTYGESVPILYESGRLAGNIIYMQDFVKTVDRSKHRQDGIRYYEMVETYTSTFAIAFCEGLMPGIVRIWINGIIFADWRDPAGEFYPVGNEALAYANLQTSIARSEAYFSIYLGSDSQTSDPALATILGAAETPTYRGVCYIVFRDFPVGEFSGIPTIEVEIGTPYTEQT